MPLQLPCPVCGKTPWPDCGCELPAGPPEPPAGAPPPEARPSAATRRKEVIHLRRERRRGRDVIVVQGFPGDVDLGELARILKTRCSAGGTVKGGAIEIQGDHRETIEAILLERGFRSKRAGG